MIPQQIIERKRDGEALDGGTLRAFFSSYLDGAVSDAQMAAFLMAVFFRGLNDVELGTTVDVMLTSGATLDLSQIPGPCVDKHSTGGVGDKVSLALAPLAAELGLFVPMMSGRALGHTGGTLDKLESIPGFQTQMELDRFTQILKSIGCAMIGQTAEIAPLDRRLYALRDVTGTVSSLPLITASIMSKKLAEDLDGLVLDVKVGSGAFLPRLEDARALAEAMVSVGEQRGLSVLATLSAMDRPLGKAVGNSLEVAEALAFLRGGPFSEFGELTLHLVGQMAKAGGLVEETAEGVARARVALSSGRALDRFRKLVEAQGGDPEVVDGQGLLPMARHMGEAVAPMAGYVATIDPRQLGYGLIRLGGGRTQSDQAVDPSVGFELLVGVGQRVERGQGLALVHARSEDDLAAGKAIALDAIRIKDTATSEIQVLPLVIEEV